MSALACLLALAALAAAAPHRPALRPAALVPALLWRNAPPTHRHKRFEEFPCAQEVPGGALWPATRCLCGNSSAHRLPRHRHHNAPLHCHATDLYQVRQADGRTTLQRLRFAGADVPSAGGGAAALGSVAFETMTTHGALPRIAAATCPVDRCWRFSPGVRAFPEGLINGAWGMWGGGGDGNACGLVKRTCTASRPTAW